MNERAPLSALPPQARALTLRRTSLWKGSYEITAGEAVVARLDLTITAASHADVLGAAYDLSHPDRKGSFSLNRAADGAPVAVFHNEPWQPPGHQTAGSYHVVFVGAMPTEFFVALGNTELARVKQSGASGPTANLVVRDAGVDDPHLMQLLLLLAHAYAASFTGGNRTGAAVGAGTFVGCSHCERLTDEIDPPALRPSGA